MHPRQVRTAATARSDNGAALIMVLIGMIVLGMFATVALTYSTQTLKTTRHTQDSIAALAAAQGGVDEYLARLNHDDSYWQTMPDCLNPAMRKYPFTGNPCPLWTSAMPVGWATLPGSTASFHYDVDTTGTATNGTINLKVTGKSNKVNRTIELTLRRAGFGEFLYFTDKETVDPANQGTYGSTNATALDRCAHYFWGPTTGATQRRPNPSFTTNNIRYCSDMSFISNDIINGPTHSNDAILMDGTPMFMGNVSTSWPDCKPINGVPPASRDHCYRDNGSANPTFKKNITYADPIDMPTSIGSLLQYVDGAQTTHPGCRYTGPTRIKLIAGHPSSMRVWSPFSKTTLNPGCGTTSATSLVGVRSAGGELVTPIPGQTTATAGANIIIVQDVPSGPGQPAGACAIGQVGDGLPQLDDLTRNLDESLCKNGNVYVEGVLGGRLTISADNNIIITGDLTYNGGKSGADQLGLIANNSVKIYHPVKCTSSSNGICTDGDDLPRPASLGGTKFINPKVQAAILTLSHSFTVQNYSLGYRSSGSLLGSISLFGSFAQRYRGPVGTHNGSTVVSGYLKNYEYDTNLRFKSPPYFLDPVHAAWGVKTFGELAAQYNGL